MAPQTIGAQLDRQPTPASMKKAEQRAQATFTATLARAKRLDARGDRAGCTRALARAKRMYNLAGMTPNLDKLPGEGMQFPDYYADLSEQEL